MPGTIVPNGARVPGTPFQLDPVQAAFNIGAMIRWLDFNDTWLAAEWGHPSDNLGGILATADWLSRNAIAAGKAPLTMKDVLVAHDQGARNSRLYRARELLQQGRARSCIAGQAGVDRGGRPVDRPHARRAHQRGLAGARRRASAAHLPPRAEHRLAQIVGRGRRRPRAPCASR